MNKFYRINFYIRAEQVRVIDETGKQIGVMPLNEALGEARKRNLDLVEVSANAKPPVCKTIDFKKFKFLEAKKEQEEKKRNKKTETKELRLSPFISENDLLVRVKRAEEFLKGKNRVKIVVRFRGRQITKKEFGYEVLKKIKERLGEKAQMETEPRAQGNQLEMLLSPTKKINNEKEKDKDKNKKIGSQKV
ncbi:MAG: translation initiation factor IF-3 [Candidatus Shapirobacteria bacterium]